MGINKSDNYGGMDWVNALKAQLQPKSYEEELNGDEPTEGALDATLNALYNTPTGKETSDEAVRRASKEIHDRQVSAATKAHVDSIKDKLSSRGIDPIALGVVSEKDWKETNDPSWTEKMAKKAAIAYQEKLSHAWEDAAKNATPAQGMKYDPQTFRDGRIVSSATANDDSVGTPSRVPSNANSILDPFKLDRFAKEETSHDKSIRLAKEEAANRAATVAKHKEESIQSLPPEHQLNAGKIVASGGKDAGEFVHRVPRNQVSIMDDLKQKLSDIFTAKLEDNRAKTVEANQARLEKIQGKKEKDRSWEKLSTPVQANNLPGVQNLKERLEKLWAPEEPK
jgi:hypothetical protein